METYYTKGVCATEIHFTVNNGILEEVKFEGGCAGNLRAISILITGMKVEDVIRKLKGVSCEDNPTSCVDQLAEALAEKLG